MRKAAPDAHRPAISAVADGIAPEAARAQPNRIGTAICSLRKKPETAATTSMPLIAANLDCPPVAAVAAQPFARVSVTQEALSIARKRIRAQWAVLDEDLQVGVVDDRILERDRVAPHVFGASTPNLAGPTPSSG